MGRRIALLADGSHQSPWTSANGAESAVRVSGLGEGDKVWLNAELVPDGVIQLCLVEGLTSLQPFNPQDWKRYQVGKVAAVGSKMTSVEVFFG